MVTKHPDMPVEIGESLSGKLGKVRQAISTLSGIADLLVLLRDKPRMLDWAAVGVKVIDVGLNIHHQIQIANQVDPWTIFQEAEQLKDWFQIPSIFWKLVKGMATNAKQVTWSSEEAHATAWMGVLGGGKVGWIQRGEAVEAIFGWKEHKERIMDSLHGALWEKVVGIHAAMSPFGLIEDQMDLVEGPIQSTNLIQQLKERAEAFLNEDEMRSYLLIGVPGTGKSTAVQHLTRELKLKSLRIPLSELSSESIDMEGPAFELSLLVQIVRPEVVIFDDIDRASYTKQGDLLEFMEVARKYVKILLATVNDPNKVITALKRPERFDDHLKVPTLDPQTIKSILGDEGDLAERMANWPIVYILDYKKRSRVLGRDKARSELEGLEERIKEAQGAEPELGKQELMRASRRASRSLYL